MKSARFATFIPLVALGLVSTMLPQAKADEWNQRTTFTFSGPVEVPGQVLPAGTYVFKLADLMSDRDVVQVFNKNQNHIYGTFLTIPDYRLKPTGKTILTFEERPAGSPEAIKAWFYPGENYGHEFVYPKMKALQLAKETKQPVPSMPNELTTTAKQTTKEAKATIEKAPLKVEQPTEEEVEVAEVFQAPPPGQRNPAPTAAKLPVTGSDLPLIGLFGLLSLGTALCLRYFPAKTR